MLLKLKATATMLAGQQRITTVLITSVMKSSSAIGWPGTEQVSLVKYETAVEFIPATRVDHYGNVAVR